MVRCSMRKCKRPGRFSHYTPKTKWHHACNMHRTVVWKTLPKIVARVPRDPNHEVSADVAELEVAIRALS